MEKENVLSDRCQSVKEEESEFMVKILKTVRLYEADQYNEETNPTGIINLGTAMNSLLADEIMQKFLSQGLEIGSDTYCYYSLHGTPRLQKAMADYMTTFFETPKPVQPDNIFFMTGVIGVMDVLAHCIADPGDVFMCVSPVYCGVSHGLETRSLVKLWPISLSSQSVDPFNVTLQDVEISYQKAISAGKRVRGILLVNPGNPTGYVVERDVLEEILLFCSRHALHFVSNELYAMSVHDPEVTFQSVLKLPSLPDPNRTHVIYGLSKDLSLTKLRVAVLHTYNKKMHGFLKLMGCCNSIPYPVMEIVANILEDKEWCKTYFAKSREILRERYLVICDKLEKLGVEVHPTPAGFYIWANFKKYCQPLSFESEDRLYNKLYQEAKVMVYPGYFFSSSDPGWFRVLIAIEEPEFYKGLERLKIFLENWK